MRIIYFALFLCLNFGVDFNLDAAQEKLKVLVGSPVRQKANIFKEFLASLDRLDKSTYDLNFYFIDDNIDLESKDLLTSFSQAHPGQVLVEEVETKASPNYVCDEITHRWKDEIIWKVAAFKDKMIEHALNQNYDYIFLIDSDIVLHPQTIGQLIKDNKEIVSNIFWTIWSPGHPELPQVWLSDTYNLFEIRPGEQLSQEQISARQYEFLGQLRKPGVYEVGGLGACTLISLSAMKKGVSFKRIKNLTFWGEDRHFCIRAAALDIGLFVDTHYPAYHIYRESNLEGVPAFILSTQEAPKHRITLSMIVKNEADRYLKRVLRSAKEYITDAVIIDDGSTDNTVQVCKEELKEIPLKMVENKESKFANEVTLRSQQWNETVATNPEWILLLDADEIFEEKAKSEIHKLVARDDVDGFTFRLYDFWDEGKYREDQYWFAHQTYRPFLIRYKPDVTYQWKDTKQHCGRFPYTICTFKMAQSPLRLKHYGWANEADRKAKYERYQKLDPGAKYGWKEQYESILDPHPHLIEWNEKEVIAPLG